MSHHHGHHVSGHKLTWTVLLNVAITMGELIGGIWSGSVALLSDAAHNFSDVLSLIIAWVAHRTARSRKQNIRQTYGYKRAEIVAAFINAATLVVVALFLIYESIMRLLHPEPVKPDAVIYLAAFSVLANGLSVWLLHSSSKHNLNMKAAYWHLFSDMLTSVAVLLGGLLMKFYGIYYTDAVLGIGIALYLTYLGVNLWWEAFEILMQFAPKEIKINEINRRLSRIPQIKNIHHIHIWQLNENEIHFEAHILFADDIKISEFDRIAEEVERILREEFGIFHTNLQPEYNRKEPHLYIIQD
ncbi:MAG: cation transporter [Chlorobi bacterium]|nr:cation transporter [Chlorobiota bacterium]